METYLKAAAICWLISVFLGIKFHEYYKEKYNNDNLSASEFFLPMIFIFSLIYSIAILII